MEGVAKSQSMMLPALRLACLAEGDTVEVLVSQNMQGREHSAPILIQPLYHATHACDDGLKPDHYDDPES